MANRIEPRRYSYEPIIRDTAMPDFTKCAITICVFVMMREFRPVEPFFTSYLTSPPLNFTTEQVNEQIYPIGTYSSFTFVIIIFLITDYLRYKPVIVLDGITGILTYCLLFGKPEMSIFFVEQMFYGFFYSSDIACNTYLYAKFDDTSLYQKITGYVRASSLIGRFISGVFSQVTISYQLLSKADLVYFSTAGMIIVTLWSFMIPSVDHSIYFHKVEKKVVQKKDNDVEDGSKEQAITVVKSEKLNVVGKHLWHDFKTAYTNIYVLKWSLWWSLALCGWFFVNTYSQVLWQVVAAEHGGEKYLMNGAIDSIYTISSALAAYLIAQMKIDWRIHGDWILCLVSVALSALVLFHYLCHSLWLIYLAYILIGIIFQTMLTISQSEVAQNIERDSYALIFGYNLFVALGLGSILTYTVIEGHLIYFTTRQQFLFYGGYFSLLAVFFAGVAIISFFKRCLNKTTL